MPSDLSSSAEKPGAVCILGATASGKSSLAMLLAGHLAQEHAINCEIISVDSSAVYRHFDIGSAKPDSAERALVPHHLLDIRDATDVYSAADFRADACQLLDEISARGNLPLLVGGSMLYFRALLYGLSTLPAADPAVRAEIEAQASADGWAAIHAELARVDPLAAKRIHPNDPQRLQRALEVYRITGTSLTDLQQSGAAEANVSANAFLQIAIAPATRELLHQRIAQRFDAMLAAGFVDEVRDLLHKRKYSVDLPAMKAVGYRQACAHLAGDLSAEEMRERGIIATRQFAKRQLTWLRGWPELQWLHPDSGDYAGNLLGITESCEQSAGNGSIFSQLLKLLHEKEILLQ